MRYRARGRKSSGHEMAEFAPAMFILLVCILPPMLDLLYLGIAYASGWYLNHLQCREVACVAPANSTDALTRARVAWEASTLARFVKGREVTSVPVRWEDRRPPPDLSSQDTAIVTTTVRIQPFLQIPFLGSIPGIGAPVDFTYMSERPQEEYGIN
ncbi:MAG: hypothetical protein IAF58_15120 [Leptolyngbya sp.]|nr:hypothetical protein [Candidatus Melainabacteria bacterium]